MRKTSHDGGDSTSITSGFENETRKSSVGIIKTKRNSIKRKVQNFSHESDDTVIEPLLQIEKTETSNRSAKYLMSKAKTDSLNERENKICSDNQFEKHSLSKPVCSTGTTCNSNITIHNHMNTNVFGCHDSSKFVTTVKSPILVEINGSKVTGNSNQTSSIFTTAKIHADSITKTMTPVQVTPLPILSTMEGNIVKAGISSDCSQNKNLEPSTSSNSKSINCFSRSDIGKSDPSTEPNLKNISTLLDSRPLDTLTKGESKFPDKTCDAQKITVTSVTNIKDAKVGSKVVQPAQSSINTITDRSSKPPQEQFDVGLKESFRLKNTESKIEKFDNVVTQNPSKSSVMTAVSKDLGATKKEDDGLSYAGSTTKQLQRQKNTIVEDPREADINRKNVNEVDKFTTSTHKDPISQGKSPTIANIEKRQPSIETILTKSKDKVEQSITVKTDSCIATEAPMISKQLSTPLTKNSPLATNMTKESTAKHSVEPIYSGSLPIKVDSTKEKKSLENQINKRAIDNTAISIGSSSKGIALNSTTSVPPSYEIASLKLDTSKDLKMSSSQSHKSIADNPSHSAINKITPKSAVSVQPTQAKDAKSDLINKDHDAESPRLLKSGKESSKSDAVKSTPSVQSSASLTKVTSDSVKEKKVEFENFAKEVNRISPAVVPVKLPITTSSISTTKSNSTKVLETTPMSKSVSTKANTPLSDKMDFKSTTDSKPHKINKSENTGTSPVIVTTTNSSLPTSNTSATKLGTTSKLLSSVPSSTNSVIVKPNTELSNRTLSTTSSMSSSSTTNSKLDKSSTATKSSLKPKSTETKGKI